jgi:hypothetical protein
MIEPREDLFKSVEEKVEFNREKAKKSGTAIEDWESLRSFRRELGGEGGTVLFSAGAYNFENPFETVENGDADAVVYGRYALPKYPNKNGILIIDGLFRIQIYRDDLKRVSL